jgi:uncharacterized cupin superfamily protein
MTYIDNSEQSARRKGVVRSEGAIAGKLGFHSIADAPALPAAAIFSLAGLDKDALQSSPIPPDWVLEGEPEAKCRNLSQIGDMWTVVDHWSCTAGKFRWQYFFDETILILEGEAFITDENGIKYHAVPGTALSFPDGSSAVWQVPDYVRKIAFNQKSVPSYLHFFCKVVNKIHRKFFR